MLLDARLLGGRDEMRLVCLIRRNAALLKYTVHDIPHFFRLMITLGKAYTELGLDVSLARMMDIEPAHNREHTARQSYARFYHAWQHERIAFRA
jgi:hypothetical protein